MKYKKLKINCNFYNKIIKTKQVSLFSHPLIEH